MSKRIVLFIDRKPLLLLGIKRGDNGKIVRAEVENGAWTLKINGSVLYSYDFYDRKVHEYEFSEYVEVEVEDKQNYNATIFDAQKILNNSQ